MSTLLWIIVVLSSLYVLSLLYDRYKYKIFLRKMFFYHFYVRSNYIDSLLICNSLCLHLIDHYKGDNKLSEEELESVLKSIDDSVGYIKTWGELNIKAVNPINKQYPYDICKDLIESLKDEISKAQIQ
jgi:hypothetical protein